MAITYAVVKKLSKQEREHRSTTGTKLLVKKCSMCEQWADSQGAPSHYNQLESCFSYSKGFRAHCTCDGCF